MSNNIRATLSIPALVAPTDDTERILRDQYLSFRTVYNRENLRRTGNIEQEPILTLDQAFYSLDREDPLSSPTSLAQSASAAIQAKEYIFHHKFWLGRPHYVFGILLTHTRTLKQPPRQSSSSSASLTSETFPSNPANC